MTAFAPLLVALAGPAPVAPPPRPVDYEAALNDRLAAGVTPEMNANVLLWRAFGPRPGGAGDGMPPEYFRRLGVPEPPAGGDYFVGATAFAKDRLKLEPDQLPAFNEAYEKVVVRPWAANDYPQMAAWLAAIEKPLAVVVEATGRPGYYNPLVSRRDKDGKPAGLIGALLPGVQPARELAHALRARAMLRLGEGDPDAAWADLLACHRLGRLIGRGGTLIEALVGYAVGGVAANATPAYLEHPGLTAAVLRGRLKELQALPPVPSVADTIDRGERLFYLDSVRLLGRGRLGPDWNPKKADPEELRRMAAVDWDLVAGDSTEWFDRIVAALRHPTRADRAKAYRVVEDELRALAGNRPAGDDALQRLLRQAGGKGVSQQISNTLLTLLLPAIGKVANAYDRTTQVEQNLQVAFALAAYRAERGKYPATLADLAPAYLKTIPGDVFSGKALVYRPAEKGYLLYSVGANVTDDGGRTFTDDHRGDDLVVRMPVE